MGAQLNATLFRLRDQLRIWWLAYAYAYAEAYAAVMTKEMIFTGR